MSCHARYGELNSCGCLVCACNPVSTHPGTSFSTICSSMAPTSLPETPALLFAAVAVPAAAISPCRTHRPSTHRCAATHSAGEAQAVLVCHHVVAGCGSAAGTRHAWLLPARIRVPPVARAHLQPHTTVSQRCASAPSFEQLFGAHRCTLLTAILLPDHSVHLPCTIYIVSAGCISSLHCSCTVPPALQPHML
jgi:hypothetical protein